MRIPAFIPAFLAMGLMGATGLPERFTQERAGWESSLEKGQSSVVRRATEALLLQEGASVNPADYNSMHALVAVANVAAKACVLEGAWEEAIGHLQRASRMATQNTTGSEETFARLRKQHMEKLAVWREAVIKQTQSLADMDAQPGLTADQAKARIQARTRLDELKNAISQSERSLAEIEGLLSQLRAEQDLYAKSLSEWEAFLAKERAEIAQAGAPAKYVSEKLEQVKADDARPRFDRIAYGRRLLKLDPSNNDCQRFVSALMGAEEESAPPPVPKAPVHKKAKKKKPSKG